MKRAAFELPRTARYALAAMTALASLEAGGRASSTALSAEVDVPGPFLAKILVQLARAGLVDGTRGRGGGYRLARPPQEMTMADVLDALGDEKADTEGEGPLCVLRNRRCAEAPECELHQLWSSASAPMDRMLRSVTLAELAGLDTGC